MTLCMNLCLSIFPSCWTENLAGRAHVLILDPYFLSWHLENICWAELLNSLLLWARPSPFVRWKWFSSSLF